MRPDISEFSYGYALTEDMIRWSPSGLTIAPVFPSLIAEGQKGGGYDVKLSFPGFPLFLQFKLSDYMKKSSAIGFDYFKEPFYRMYLRPPRHSNQHYLLLELEKSGNEVYYAAPTFHEVSELNVAYVSKNVANLSAFISPSEIGVLTDDGEHNVSFDRSRQKAILYSEPRGITIFTTKELAERLRRKLDVHSNAEANLHTMMNSIGKTMIEINVLQQKLMIASFS